MRRESVKLVADTGVLLLILKGDLRIKEVIKKLTKGAKVYTAVTNLTEVYYKTREKLGKETALTWFNELLYSPDINVVEIDANLALKAGEIKTKYRNLVSLADAILLALADKLKAVVLTTDTRLEEIEDFKVEVYPI